MAARRRERQVILGSVSGDAMSVKCAHQCAICLKRIHRGEQFRLGCGHIYHAPCLKEWGTRTAVNGVYNGVRPCRSRTINLYKEGENIFTCPCCRIEYTHCACTAKIRKVLAKIHVGDMVHYITDPMETVIFVPLKEFDEDECVSGKWATILSLVKKAWETGKTDIYAVVQTTCAVELEVEFALTTLAIPHQQLCPYVQLPPLDLSLIHI